MSSNVFLRVMVSLILFVFVTLLLFPLDTTTQAQVKKTICVTRLSNSIEVNLDSSYKITLAPVSTLPAHTNIEYVGQTPDRKFWILRIADGYALYSTSNPDLRPEGCEVSMWGPPLPDYRPLATVMTEIGIDARHKAGYFGQGVRVGVISTRFDGLDVLLAGMPHDSIHVTLLQPVEDLMLVAPNVNDTLPYTGTNVLEVLTAIAPQAEYVVTRATTAEQFQAAVDGLIAEDVQFIVYAENVITSNSDPYHDAVRSARAADILWINSAGNIGAGYYPGRFSGSGLLPLHQFEDPNRSGLQQGLMVPIKRDGPVAVTVVWENRAPEQLTNDFDLVVSGNCRLDAMETIQLRSDNNQITGNADPIERVWLTPDDLAQLGDYLTVPGAGTQQICSNSEQPDGVADNEIYISLLDAGGSSAVNTPFGVYVEGALPATYDPDINLSLDPAVLPPGDIPESLTVGAFDPRTNQMAWYSGRYNSLQYYAVNGEVDYSDDEIVKPDIVTYGELLLPSGREFFGSSASTSIVGGVSAVLASGNLVGEQVDPKTVGEILVTQNIECLDNDGAVSQVLGKVVLSPVSPKNPTDVTCGQYTWSDDLSSVFVADYKSLVVSDIEKEHESLARISEAVRLAAANTGYNPQYSLLLNIEAIRFADIYEAKNNLFSVLQSIRYYDASGFDPDLSNRLFEIEAFFENQQLLGFSPDSSHLITGSVPNEIHVWDISQGFPILQEAFLLGNKINIKVLSTDGSLVGFAEIVDEEIRLYDVFDRSLISSPIPLPSIDNNSFDKFVLDREKQIIVGSNSQSFAVWDLSTQQLLGVQEKYESDARQYGFQFDQHGNLYFIAKYDDWQLVADLLTDEVVIEESLPASGWPTVSPNGKLVAIPNSDGQIILFELETGTKRTLSFDFSSIDTSSFSYPVSFSENMEVQVFFSSDSSIVALSASIGSRLYEPASSIIFWNTETSQLLGYHVMTDYLYASEIVFSPDKSYVLLVGEGPCGQGPGCFGQVQIGTLQNEVLSEIIPLTFTSGGLHDLTISPDGESIFWLEMESPYISGLGFEMVSQIILWGSKDQDYILWKPVISTPALSSEIQRPAYISPDIQTIAWMSESQNNYSSSNIFVWEIGNDTFKTITADANDIALSSDRKRVAVSSAHSCSASVYSVESAERIVELEPRCVEDNENTFLSFSPNSRWLAAANNTAVTIWDSETFTRQIIPITSLLHPVFGPDENILIVLEDQRLVYWDISLEKAIKEISLENRVNITHISFTPDGNVLAIVAGVPGENYLEIWDATTGRVISDQIEIDATEISAFAFSPNTDYIGVGGDFGGNTGVILFDVDEQKALGSIIKMAIPHSLQFNQEGTKLYAFTEDALFEINLNLEDWTDLACRYLTRNLTSAEWNMHFPGEEYRETCDLSYLN
ncbi:hypothetical protein [Aggregatilinea lenta]|uniref:hypothetical protein n=1 Tax=Aggregatilinea lenta TaxID=913108 RepID=UPI0013C29F16|nr:hypothetical protein [Aggregatilinea lenta]